MQITLTVDDALVARAADLTGVTDPAALVGAALAALVRRESSRRLATLGGSDPDATAGVRRRDPSAT